MGKRSNFERVERDYYRTWDKRAGNALRPFVYSSRSKNVLEPFAGAGDLPENIGLSALHWTLSDIEPQSGHVEKIDAFSLTKDDCQQFDMLVTNSPWRRDIFHRAVEHFTPMIDECWWLIDAPWLFTGQAAKILDKYVTDIVTIGRMKWIPDSKMQAKDDCIWLRTCRDKSDAIKFYGKETKE